MVRFLLSLALLLHATTTINGKPEFLFESIQKEQDDNHSNNNKNNVRRRRLQLFNRNRLNTDRTQRKFTSWENADGLPNNDRSIGCRDAESGTGNPNDFVHCFDKVAGVRVGGVRFFLDPVALPSTTLQVKIWSDSLDEVLYSQDVNDYVGGENVVNFDRVFFVGIRQRQVCVGVGGEDPTDTVRLEADNDNFEMRMNSYARAPLCETEEFTSLTDLNPRLGNVTWNFQLLLGPQGDQK